MIIQKFTEINIAFVAFFVCALFNYYTEHKLDTEYIIVGR